jgi:hypothetical protein
LLNKRQNATSDGAERQVSVVYTMTEQKKKLLKAKIAAALYHENGKVPSREEIEKWTKFAKVLYTAVLGLHFERQQQKKDEQLVIF